jgi:GTP-binding protein Era
MKEPLSSDYIDDISQMPPDEPTRRVGFVALVGKPNVGKSTLLNALLGQKVAIVSWRPQTTRVPLRGILTREDAQVIFIDTPGIHEPNHALGEFMVKLANRIIPEADIICMMVDISTPPTELDRRIARQVSQANLPRLLVLNKVDVRPRHGSQLEAYRDLGEWDMEIAVSARKGTGLPALLDELVARLPLGEPLYPEDWMVDQSVRHLAAEMVREKALFFTQQEVPHAVAVEVEEWQEKDHATYIRMTINVERDSQKGILIGAGGAMLKRIGQAARADIERMLECPVYLDLWVKTRPNWRNDLSSLGWLGYKLGDWQ